MSPVVILTAVSTMGLTLGLSFMAFGRFLHSEVMKPVDQLIQAMSNGTRVNRDQTLPSWMRGLIQVAQPIGMVLTSPDTHKDLRKDLLAAGRPYGFELEQFAGLRLLAVLFGAITGFCYLQTVAACGLGAVSGWFLINQWLKGLVQSRQARMRADLPDFLDCDAINQAAGSPIDAALMDVTAQFDGPLRSEMDEVLAQISLNVPRQNAFRQLRDRNPSPEMEGVTLAIVNGLQLGVPLADALKGQAQALRNTRAQRARQLAAQVTPRITVVSTLLITPAVLLLVVGLLVLNFMFNPEFEGMRTMFN